MAWPWQRKHDPVAREVADQLARSKQVLQRVEDVLRKTAEVLPSKRDAALLDDYQAAERERTGR